MGVTRLFRDSFLSSGPILNLGPILLLALSLGFGVCTTAKAQEFSSSKPNDEIIGDGKIEIIYPATEAAPYLERRSNWGIQFGIDQENFLPSHFVSSNDSYTYKQMFGDASIQIVEASLGVKYNFGLGALTFDVVGGSGSVSNGLTGVTRGLSVVKRAVAVGYTMDAIMKEPYVAPYAKFQVFDFTYSDQGSINGDSTGTTAWTTGFTIGLLIQLNSIDPTDAALRANSDYGLNNTYLDVFATQYNTSNAKDDPEFETALNWGAGIRLEF
jgi:hypothetical protein